MATIKTTREELIKDIKDALMLEMRELMREYACPMNPNDKEEVQIFYQFVKDAGDGKSISSGVRNLRSIIDFVAGVKTKKTVATGVAFFLFVTALAGWLLTTVASGLKESLKAWMLG
jgi:hypothetical protein